MSVEGIGIVQRNDANESFYGKAFSTEQILFAPYNTVRPREPAGQAAVDALHNVRILEKEYAVNSYSF